MKIYLVVGTTGEYSDRSTWYVCAYPNKKDAEKHADEAKLWDHQHGEEWENTLRSERLQNPLDPYYDRDYTGTDYYVNECELKERFAP